jgi:hypothetical protein
MSSCLISACRNGNDLRGHCDGKHQVWRSWSLWLRWHGDIQRRFPLIADAAYGSRQRPALTDTLIVISKSILSFLHQLKLNNGHRTARCGPNIWNGRHVLRLQRAHPILIDGSSPRSGRSISVLRLPKRGISIAALRVLKNACFG